MLKSIRFGIGATLLAAAQLASAGSAEVRISNLTLSVTGGEWWYWMPANVDWLTPTSGASSALLGPIVTDGTTGWHGNALGASVVDGASFATAAIGAATSADFNGASATAAVVAVEAGTELLGAGQGLAIAYRPQGAGLLSVDFSAHPARRASYITDDARVGVFLALIHSTTELLSRG